MSTSVMRRCLLVVVLSMFGAALAALVYAASAVASPAPLRADARRLAHRRYWTRADSRRMLHNEMIEMHIPDLYHAKLRRWMIDIIWLGAHESSGDTRLMAGQYIGIFQFNPSWHQSRRERRLARLERHHHKWGGWRACGVCSMRRWVRSVRGYRYNYGAIRRQWPTLGR